MKRLTKYYLTLFLSVFYAALSQSALTPSAMAQTGDHDRLETVRQQKQAQEARQAELEKNRQSVLKEIKGLKSELVKLGGAAKDNEANSRAIERRLAKLEQQEKTLQKAVYGDRQNLQHLLGALQRVEANPPPTLLISPGHVTDSFRAGKIITAISADLKTRTDILAGELDALNTLRAAIEADKNRLAKSEKRLSANMRQVQTVVERKSTLERSISEQRRAVIARVNELAKEADSLQDFIRQLEEQAAEVMPRLKPEPGQDEENGTGSKSTAPTANLPKLALPPGARPFAKAQNDVRAPVHGNISRSYSSKHKGLTIKTRRSAQVVAPYTGRVEFAGPFKNYGKVVIMNAGEGYFILLTGLGEIFVQSGEMIEAGQPLGAMPVGKKPTSELYLEVRRSGAPINPTPWFGTAFAAPG